MATAPWRSFASRYDIHPNMITKWKRQALAGMKEASAVMRPIVISATKRMIKTLHLAKVGELIVERDFLAKAFDR